MINRTAARGGIVVIPSFAVGRAQTLLHCIHLLKEARRDSADVPVYPQQPDGSRRHAHLSTTIAASTGSTPGNATPCAAA